MAARRNAGRRQSYNSAARQTYVYGNVVEKPQYEPKRQEKKPERKRQISRQVRQNRKKALHMNPGYVVFLTAAAVCALLICVNYVNLQSRITKRSKNITAMQAELVDLKEKNNTRYNTIMDSVNLEEVRVSAQDKLGMVYATEAQVIEYQRPSADYVKQYESIPEEGVLAQSNKK